MKIKNPKDLIMNLDEIKKWRCELRKQEKKLVVTNGCFDILHRGHAEYLMEARNNGDALLILVNSDESVRALKGPTRPVVDEYNRGYMLASLASVDAITYFTDERCTNLFLEIKPDIYIKGGDYTIDTINQEERKALESVEAEFVFIPFVKGFSTTTILEKIIKTT